jgi:D-alanyl-D-alanine carboxypeptidase/D-alanyl-D-alanine-endopeptidase (penicillin-binding protein 4)
MKHNVIFYLIVILVCLTVMQIAPTCNAAPPAARWTSVARMISTRDALLIADAGGRILYARNADKPLVPASTLKLLTSLVALHYLGADYRFVTEFYVDRHSNLKIKGYGDPLLISEALEQLADALKRSSALQGLHLHDLIVDDTYFAAPISIPGIAEDPFQPYNAPVGALCVNFNTIAFKVEQRRPLQLVSKEPQTPLLPFAERCIRQRLSDRPPSGGRMVLSRQGGEHTLYAGHLMRYYLQQAGIAIHGKIRTGTVNPHTDRLVYRYRSAYTVNDVIENLLHYSNNFIANQLLLHSGAKVFGPPATLDKGVRSAIQYVQTHFKLKGHNLTLVEGSGISRRNRITARMLHRILIRFSACYTCLRHQKGDYYKTGTLNGIRTRAGYLKISDTQGYHYVIMLNTPGKSAETVVARLRKICRSDSVCSRTAAAQSVFRK